jgi:hypothetical protein
VTDVRSVVTEFRGSDNRRRMAHCIEQSVTVFKVYSKQACFEISTQAIKEGRSGKNSDYVKSRQSISSGDSGCLNSTLWSNC